MIKIICLSVALFAASCSNSIPMSFSSETTEFNGDYYAIIEWDGTPEYFSRFDTRVNMKIRGNVVEYSYKSHGGTVGTGNWVIDDINKIYQGNEYYKSEYVGLMNLTETKDTLIFTFDNGAYSWYKRK